MENPSPRPRKMTLRSQETYWKREGRRNSPRWPASELPDRGPEEQPEQFEKLTPRCPAKGTKLVRSLGHGTLTKQQQFPKQMAERDPIGPRGELAPLSKPH